MTTGIRKPGDFCWINVLTPQPSAARAFFAQILGWTCLELPGMGHLVQVGGHSIGALIDLESPNTPKGTPPGIGVMLKVTSADATCQRVAALGGTAKPAFDVLENGRMAVCFDPNGGEFDVWEPKQKPGTDVDSTLHGAPSWFETLTSDTARASKFYSSLFGWTPEEMPFPNGTYTVFTLGAAGVAGMLPIGPRMGAMRPHWRTYFTVKDADEAARKAVELGATISMAMREAPGGGRFCELTSPQGVAFCVSQPAR